MPILQDSLQNAQAGVPNPAATAATSPQNMDQAAAAPGGPPTESKLPPPDPAINSPLVKAHIDELANMERVMTPGMRKTYAKMLKIGKDLLYAPETAEAVQGLILDDSLPMENKLGEGVANLVIMMDNKANGTIPKDMLIPVGVSLLFEAVDYMYECGIEVTEEELSDGLEMMVYAVYQGYNIPAEEVDAMIGKLADSLDLDKAKEEGVPEKVMGAIKGREEKQAKVAEAVSPEAGSQLSPDSEEAAFEEGFAEDQKKRGA